MKTYLFKLQKSDEKNHEWNEHVVWRRQGMHNCVDYLLMSKRFQQRFLQKLLLSWDVNDVCEWLGELGLSQYSEIFRTNEIDGAELANIDNKILSDDLGIAPLGHRNKILREIKRIKAEELDGMVPDEFLCPVTREIMTDPVIASDGFSYERSAITGWIESGKVTSPMTNAPLNNPNLTPNRSLKNAIMRHFASAPSACLL
eukprot:gene14856-5981_t